MTFDPLEHRGAHGKWEKGSGAVEAAVKGAVRSTKKVKLRAPKPEKAGPTPEERVATRAKLDANPISAQNIVDRYEQATPGEIAVGHEWYPSAHKIAEAFSKKRGVTLRQAAGVVANYSAQTPWGQNLITAHETLLTGKAVGGKGAHLNIDTDPLTPYKEERTGVMVTASQKARAQQILGGMDFQEVFAGGRNKNGSLKPNSLKVRAFASLITHGGQKPGSKIPQVVIDRHAASVARGITMSENDYGVDGPSSSMKKFEAYASAYRDAAEALSKKHGRTVTPEEVQAVTWLVQQRINGGNDTRRASLGKRDAKRALGYFAQNDPDVAAILQTPMVGYTNLSRPKIPYGGDEIDLVRHVRTPQGAAMYHLPIGSPIVGHAHEPGGKFTLTTGSHKWTEFSKDTLAKLPKGVTVAPDGDLAYTARGDGKFVDPSGIIWSPDEVLSMIDRRNAYVHVPGGKLKPVARPATPQEPVTPTRSKWPPNPQKLNVGGQTVKFDDLTGMLGKLYAWDSMERDGAAKGDHPSVVEQERAQTVAAVWSTAPARADEVAAQVWGDYQSPNNYGDINSELRTGEPVYSSNPGKIREAVGRMFTKGGYTTEKPTTLFRALKSNDGPKRAATYHDWSQELKPGSTFTDNGIVSTTAHSKFAQGWLMNDAQGAQTGRQNPHDVVLEIRVPQGTRVVGGNPEFIETMLPPGSKFKIVSSETRQSAAIDPLTRAKAQFPYTHVVAELAAP